MRLLYSLFIIIFFFSPVIFSQTENADTTSVSDTNEEKELENLLENSDNDELDNSSLLDELEYYRKNPIDVRSASVEDLTVIPFISPNTAEKILFISDSVKTPKQFFARLKVIEQQQKISLKPYLTFSVEEKTSMPEIFNNISATFRSRYSSDIEKSQEIPSDEYYGSLYKNYNRLQFGNKAWNATVLYEKDAGEDFRSGFFSGYVAVNDISILQKLLVGNFSLNTGQGLVVGRFSPSSKVGTPVFQIKKRGSRILPYNSADEFNYFTGGAATIEVQKFSLTPFFSQRKLPASIDDSNYVTSLYTAGLFRTATEQNKRAALQEQLFGAMGSYSPNATNKVGVSILHARYDTPLRLNIPYAFKGEQVTVAGVDADVMIHSINFFGELAGNDIHSLGGIVGAMFPVTKNFTLGIHLRSYSQQFMNPFASAFSERGIPNGEQGKYLGADFRATSWLQFFSYYDSYTVFSSSVFPLDGGEYFLRTEVIPVRPLEIAVQVKQKTEEAMYTINDDGEKILQERGQYKVRLEYSYNVSRNILFKQRVEYTNVGYSITEEQEKGVLLFTSIKLQELFPQFSCEGRIVFYETDSYDSRLYQYESDVAGAVSNPPLYGKGQRWYILGKYEFYPKMNLSFKYGETIKPPTSSTISIDNKFTVQLDILL